MHVKPLLQSLLDFPCIVIDYPQSRPIFHLLYGKRMLLIEAETATPTTKKMVHIESRYQLGVLTELALAQTFVMPTWLHGLFVLAQ